MAYRQTDTYNGTKTLGTLERELDWREVGGV